MSRTLVLIAAGIGLVAYAGQSDGAERFDRKARLASGEPFLVALHDGYRAAAALCGKAHDATCTNYFSERADAVGAADTNGADDALMPLHFEILAERAAARDPALTGAYEETWSLSQSEAADRAPYLVSQVQVAFEGWLQEAIEGDAASAGRWRARWAAAVDGLVPGHDPIAERVFDSAVL